ncbi:MAG TPA: KUP/HAK/KT family potassium transporter, partial [Devosia sp.]|nr:KUP/HAK/KT family potassium transporter [Devosia sp.]
MTQTNAASIDVGLDAAEQVTHAKKNFPVLVLGAIGVVYGDIGTSPIYAFRQA